MKSVKCLCLLFLVSWLIACEGEDERPGYPAHLGLTGDFQWLQSCQVDRDSVAYINWEDASWHASDTNTFDPPKRGAGYIVDWFTFYNLEKVYLTEQSGCFYWFDSLTNKKVLFLKKDMEQGDYWETSGVASDEVTRTYGYEVVGYIEETLINGISYQNVYLVAARFYYGEEPSYPGPFYWVSEGAGVVRVMGRFHFCFGALEKL